MYSKNDHFLIKFFSWNFTGIGNSSMAAGSKFCASLLFFGIAFIFSLCSVSNIPASEQTESGRYEDLDARWLPWIGSWRLVSNKINTAERSSMEEYFLTISPGGSKDAINMRGYRNDSVVVDEEIIADGLRHSLKDEECPGYVIYSWSETGKRLLLDGESKCTGDPAREISGMSIIDDNGDWLDIQLMKTGEEKAVSIRRYRNVDSDLITSERFNPSQISMSRIAAGKNFSIPEIIELSSKVEPEVIEAALLEIRKPFPINSKQIVAMSDSGVPSRIVDLMVALSFPDKFTVEQDEISLAQGTGPGSNYMLFRSPYPYYPYDYPISPWHWAWPYYMSCGYSYLGWYILGGSCYYPLWTYPPPIYGGGGGSAVRENGALIQGHGYMRVDSNSPVSIPRRAMPRVAPAAQGVPVQATSAPPPSGTSSSYSGGASGGSSGVAAPINPGGGSPSASPNGYSSGRR